MAVADRGEDTEMDDYWMKIGDMTILFEKWPTHKLPVMAVRFHGEARVYKVASFNSEIVMKWFIECLEEQVLKEVQNDDF